MVTVDEQPRQVEMPATDELNQEIGSVNPNPPSHLNTKLLTSSPKEKEAIYTAEDMVALQAKILSVVDQRMKENQARERSHQHLSDFSKPFPKSHILKTRRLPQRPPRLNNEGSQRDVLGRSLKGCDANPVPADVLAPVEMIKVMVKSFSQPAIETQSEMSQFVTFV